MKFKIVQIGCISNLMQNYNKLETDANIKTFFWYYSQVSIFCIISQRRKRWEAERSSELAALCRQQVTVQALTAS